MELLVILLCVSWCISVTEQTPSYLITAPTIVRAGVKETITVQLFEARGNVDATIYLLNQKNMLVCSEKHRVKLNNTNNFTEVIYVQILPEKVKQCGLSQRRSYITLTAEIPKLFTKRRMVHLQLRPKPYFIFIETDKPTYRLNDTVRFRTFSLDHEMKLTSCAVKMHIWHSGSVVMETKSHKHGSDAVCRGEVNIPPSLVGDFEIQGAPTEYSVHIGYRNFQVKEQGYKEEKNRDVAKNITKVLPYTINLTKTKRYFMTGAPFRILALVTYPDGSPVAEVPIKIEIIISEEKTIQATQRGFTDNIGELSLSLNVPENASDIYITAIAGNTANGTQAKTDIAIKCQSSNQMYLYIDVPNALLYPGDIIYVTLSAFSQLDISSVNYFYYMVLNKGKLLHFERIRRSANTSFSIMITKDMVPYFRIVAYYIININNKKNIVSDSVRVEVENHCNSKFQIQPALYTDNDQRDLLLSVFSDSVSDVYVQALDTQLYGPSKDMNTLQKAFYRKDFYDFGSSYGGGKNTVGVFEDAGLRLISDLMESTDLRDITTIPWKRGPLTSPRNVIEIANTHHTIHPIYDHGWVWEIQKTSGKKTYRLTSDIDPPKSWEISAFSISEEGEICIVKPLVMKLDDSI
ncbi:complement C3-like [Heterodontus francisci]|uniref:complement C3-like n=1 Tax=Heterodontus francisci TaxID=7792 RepID=UPI00355B62B8